MSRGNISVVSTEIDEVNCPVELEPYSDPVVLVDCGHSFSASGLAKLKIAQCPTCRAAITRPPVPNFALRQIMETKGQPVTEVYELFCIDVSTSMWYSDFFGPLSLIVGKSRITIAQEFCQKISIERQQDESHKMGLISFGSNITDKCLFGTPREFRASLQSLEPNEPKTRLFDAFEHAVDHLSKMRNSQIRLYLLTDGGENFSSDENAAKFKSKLSAVVESAKRLRLTTVVFNVGGDIDKAKKTADAFGAKFKHIDSKNVSTVARDLCKVEFPNRELQIMNLFQTAQMPSTESVVVRTPVLSKSSSLSSSGPLSPPQSSPVSSSPSRIRTSVPA